MSDKGWEALGEQVKDAVNSAISSGDYQNLSRSIGSLVNDALDLAGKNRNQWRDARPGAGSGRRNTPPRPVLYNKKPGGMGGSIAMMVFGYTLLTVGAVFALMFLALGMAAPVFFVPSAVFFVLLGVGLWLGLTGTGRYQFLRRFRTYTSQLGWQLCVPLDALAERAGRPVKKVARDLRKMIDQRLFYEAHLDAENGYLLLTDRAYEEYQKTKEEAFRRQKEQKRREEQQRERREAERRAQEQLSPECRGMIEKGESYLKYIRKCNDDIPGREISEKLDKMEELVRRIFEEVKRNPEQVSELDKMIEYYLPTTAKLLDAYRELDDQPDPGENVSRTKKEIEDAVDTLNIAFEKLLDSLFADRAWDISSDISVLNTVLAQDGLTGGDFSTDKANTP